ncbi:MAG: biotin/lipoyl-containing protein, partial [Methylococcus sp.]
MRIEVLVPNLPESVSDATLLDWQHKAGERVNKDDKLIELETDKVILEVPVPETGLLQEIRRSKGDVVSSGDLLAVIETEAATGVAEGPTSIQTGPATAPPEPPPTEPATPPAQAPAMAAYSQPISPTVR